MKRHIFSGLFVLTVLFSTGCGNSSTSKSEDAQKTEENTATEQDFAAFWTAFRKAILSKDLEQLNKRVRYPFMALGPMDNDEMILYTDFSSFNTMFQAFLESPTGLNPSNFNETQRQYIEANENIVFNEYKLPMRTDTTASITAMGFANENKGWKLVMVYLDENNYTKFHKQPN